MAEFKLFLRNDTLVWPGITEYRASIGLTTDWQDFDEAGKPSAERS